MTPYQKLRRHVLCAAATAALGLSLPSVAQSDFANRPVKIVIPLPAGGAADAIMRAMAVEV